MRIKSSHLGGINKMQFLNNPWIYLSEVVLHQSPISSSSPSSPSSNKHDEHSSQSHLNISTVAVCDEHNLIAVATTDGKITTYLKKEIIYGHRINRTDFITKQFLGHSLDGDHDSYFTKLCWQGGANCTNLVCGRNNGNILYIDVLPTKSLDTDQTDELIQLDLNQDIHQDEIVDFQWSKKKEDNEELSHLLSVDKSGCCCLWKTELNVALIPVTKYHNDNPITVVSFVDSLFPQTDCHNDFLFALNNKSVYHANEIGHCNQISMREDSDTVEVIKCYKHCVILITRSSQLVQMKAVDGIIVPIKNAKINIDLDFSNNVLLASHGQLICMTTKGTVHCFDMESNENYEMKLPESSQNDSGNMITPTSMAMSSTGDSICVSFSNNDCVFWNFDDCADKWFLSDIETPNSTILQDKQISCAFAGDMVCLHDERDLALFVQEYAVSTCSHEIIALQTGPTTIAMFSENDMGAFSNLDTGMKIQGMIMDALMLCVYSNEKIHLYKVDVSGYFHLHSEIHMKVQSVALTSESLFLAKDNTLIITDFFGVQRLTMNLPKTEGNILHLQALNDVLTMVTHLGTIKTFDVVRKEPKSLYVIHELFRECCESVCISNLISVRSNSDGTIVSMVFKVRGGHQMRFCFMESGVTKAAEVITEGDCLVVSHCWDSAFSNLFACEVRDNRKNQTKFITMYVSENNIYVHEAISSQKWSQWVGVSAPMNLCVSKMTDSSELVLHRAPIEGFEGVDPSNAESIATMVNFFFHLHGGCLDKAYFAILCDQNSQHAWNKLAQASVTHNCIDIAERCLIKLGNVVGVASVRKAEKDVALAEAAIQLGMYSEAEKIYKAANRPELLCELYRRQGLYEEASQVNEGLCIKASKVNFQIEKQKDYHQHLVICSNNHSSSAMRKSFSSKQVVITKLIQANESVEAFLKQENDIELFKWYAKYLENRGNLDGAKAIYTAVDDNISLVRIACLEGDLSGGFTVVKQTKSSGGAYYLARYLEANGDIKEAIDCFGRSGMFHYAIRLSKIFGIHDELAHFASKCETPKAIECANYLENLGYQEKAAEIYLKIQYHENALKIIAKLPLDGNTARLKAEVLSIADNLDSNESMMAITDCATIMLRSGMYKNAIQLLQKRSMDIESILQICSENDIIFNEAILNEVMTHFKEKMDKVQFMKIALLCENQDNHILACKLYTQGGNRPKAIKSLLYTGDTKKILAYAFTSRSSEVYIMVANYLQKLEYYHNEEMKRALLQLYTKAKSNEHLARLMMSWASFEATDGEYKIAFKWLMEGQKYSIDDEGKEFLSEEEQNWIRKNLTNLQLFDKAQKIALTDKSQANELCKEIMNTHERGDLIQIGDCYALLVQIQVHFQDAYELIKEMKYRGLSPSDYIEDEVINQIHQNINIDDNNEE